MAVVIVTCTSFWLIFFVVPNNEYFLYSIVPDQWKGIWMYLLFGFLIEGRIMLYHTFFVMFTMTFGFVYCQGSMTWIKRIR
jgi:hypothetical protein